MLQCIRKPLLFKNLSYLKDLLQFFFLFKTTTTTNDCLRVNLYQSTFIRQSFEVQNDCHRGIKNSCGERGEREKNTELYVQTMGERSMNLIDREREKRL